MKKEERTATKRIMVEKITSSTQNHGGKQPENQRKERMRRKERRRKGTTRSPGRRKEKKPAKAGRLGRMKRGATAPKDARMDTSLERKGTVKGGKRRSRM